MWEALKARQDKGTDSPQVSSERNTAQLTPLLLPRPKVHLGYEALGTCYLVIDN